MKFKKNPASLASFCVFLFNSQSAFTFQIFLSVPILHHQIPSPYGDWRGEMPKIERTKIFLGCKTSASGQTRKNVKLWIKHMSNHTFGSQGSSESHVCKICPGRTFFSPIPSPTAAPIYFVHFRKVQVLNLGRKSNQSAIWSKRFQTQDEH